MVQRPPNIDTNTPRVLLLICLLDGEAYANTYKSRDQHIASGFTGGAGASASGSYSANTLNGDYASVREQSGIQAGDGRVLWRK